jgi:Protein of unknown function (DUF3102)
MKKKVDNENTVEVVGENEREVYEKVSPHNKRRLSRITEQVRNKLKSFRRSFYEIGKLLSDAKGWVGHGNFQRWIKETFDDELPYSTANMYMAIFDKFENRPDLVEGMGVKFLLDLSRGEDKDSVIKELEKYLAEGRLDELKEKVKKEHEKSISKDYIGLQRRIIEGFEDAKRLSWVCGALSKRIRDLGSLRYNDLEVLGYLKRLEEDGLVEDLMKTRKALEDVEQAYLFARKRCEGATESHDTQETEAAANI